MSDADNAVLDGILHTDMAMRSGKLKIVRGYCPSLEEELAGYQWDKAAADKGLDKPVDGNDHECDALRYLTKGIIGSVYYDVNPMYNRVTPSDAGIDWDDFKH